MRDVTQEIVRVAEELKLGIICVQEPYIKNGKMMGEFPWGL